MRLQILICIVLSLLQTSIVPINLTLSYLLALAFISGKNIDYLISFLSGLLVGLLSGYNLSLFPFFYIFATFLMHLTRILPLSNNWLTFLISSTIVIISSKLISQLALHERPNYLYTPFELAFCLFIFLLLIRFGKVKKQNDKLRL